MEQELTGTQAKVLDFVAGFLRDRGFPPTLREIGKACGISSTGSVTFHLKALEAKGILKRSGFASRALELLEAPFRLPILGRVGAGHPTLAGEDVEGWLPLDRDAAKGAVYALRVKGDSMEAEGIYAGDLVLVRPQKAARDGELVVALAEEVGTVKRFRAGPPPRLEAAPLEAGKYPPMRGHFDVLGKVVGLFRAYA